MDIFGLSARIQRRKNGTGLLPEEKCRQNYFDLRALFDDVIENQDRYEMVYAYATECVPVGGGWNAGQVLVFRSYAMGFDTSGNELVLLRVKADLSGYSGLCCLQDGEINEAEQRKSSYDDIDVFIQADSLPGRCIELHIPWKINKNTDEEVMPIEQNEEAEHFLEFFNKQFCKKSV